MEGIEPSEVATSQSMVAPCAPRHFISKRVITFMSNALVRGYRGFVFWNIRSRYFRRYGLCRTAYEPLALVGRFEHPWGATPQLQCSLTLPSSITVAHYSFDSYAFCVS